MKYSLDFETYSEADLQKVGAYRYAKDPSAEVLCLAISRNHGKPLLWVPPAYQYQLSFIDPMEQMEAQDLLVEMMSDESNLVYAHNAAFEYVLWNEVMVKQHKFRPLNPKQMRCTQAMARRACIPQSLAKCGGYLQLGQQKNARGLTLIRKFCIPQKPDKTHGVMWRRFPQDDPALFKEFCEYCIQDVRSEQEVEKALKLFDVGGISHAAFVYDLIINDEGFPVDLDALRSASTMIDNELDRVRGEFIKLTGINPTQTGAFLIWLRERGYRGEDLRGDTMDEEIENWEPFTSDMSEDAIKALELRRVMSYAATKKVKSMLELAGPDDNRVRGTLFYHGASTGRWSSKQVQQQNMKRSTDESEAAFKHLRQGLSADTLELIHGPILETLASGIRHFINDGDAPLDSVDYAAIEARIVCWLAGQEDALDEFNRNIDRYKTMAARIFKIRPEDVTKPQRFLGKQSVLGCIAEGQLVLTDMGLIPIEQVSCLHRVWDGVGWVHHEGVIYKGEQEVITYQGLTATRDHVVFIRDGLGFERTAHFGDAARTKATLIVSAEGRTPIRSVEADEPQNFSELRQSEVCQSQVFGLFQSDDARLPQLGTRKEFGVRPMRPQTPENMPCSPMAGEAIRSRQGEVRQPQECTVLQLRRQGDRVSVSHSEHCSNLDHGEPWAAQGHGNRPHRQQWSLRIKECSLGNTPTADEEHTTLQSPDGFCSGGLAVLRANNDEVSPPWHDTGSSPGESPTSGAGETQTLGKDSRVVRVYDILNAGPRHRFTVSNKLVHNCGYGMGASKFQATCASYGEDIPMDLAELAVQTFRKTHRQVVSLWYDLERACRKAISNPGNKYVVGKLEVFTLATAGRRFMMIKLPSKRHLSFPDPAIEDDQITFYGQVPMKQVWGRISTYGGKLVENCLTGDTLVLTEQGWVPLNQITYQPVHDGIDFVAHDGLIAQGKQVVITVAGFTATPDHKFLTKLGWKPLCCVQGEYELVSPDEQEISIQGKAQQTTESGRETVRNHGRCRVVPHQRQNLLGCVVRLWRVCREGWDRLIQKCGQASVLLKRVQSCPSKHYSQTNHTWDVQAPSLGSVAQHEAEMFGQQSSSIQKLRWQRDSGLRGMGELICYILEGHGRHMAEGYGIGQGGQSRALQTGELPMDYQTGQLCKQAEQCGESGRIGFVRPERDWSVNPLLEVAERGEDGGSPNQSTIPVQEVFDLRNCGKRRRFVVKSPTTGKIAIAHNCTQGVAADVMTMGLVNAVKAGHKVVMLVHDEAVRITRGSPHSLDHFTKCLTDMPEWASGLPLAAEGATIEFYTK